MKSFQRLSIVILVFLGLFLFRGSFFRLTVTYTYLGEREEIRISNPEIETRLVKERELSLQEIHHIARSITNESLQFSSQQLSQSPNSVLKSGKANCIGYSALFNSIASYLIEKQGYSNRFQSKHLIGKIEFLGIDLHSFLIIPSLKIMISICWKIWKLGK